jgi:hypothetical protein
MFYRWEQTKNGASTTKVQFCNIEGLLNAAWDAESFPDWLADNEEPALEDLADDAIIRRYAEFVGDAEAAHVVVEEIAYSEYIAGNRPSVGAVMDGEANK